MGLMKPLLPNEIPVEHRDRVSFTEQWSEKSKSGKSRAYVTIRCAVCSESRPVPINDVRNYVRGQMRTKMFPGTHRACRYEGRMVTKDGYVWLYMKDHPNAYDGKYVPEHIYLMEQKLGRYLNTKIESVHHINGDHADNRIENLQLRKAHHGKGQAWECRDCGSTNVTAVELK